ncbi:MAG: hypothetical protein NZM31_15460 [Gemmatales bacterium]|nr:hypothetical protein [Gemmatales bacterium]MDW8388394.1 hypothetical protein [Gemmatales bacterium]
MKRYAMAKSREEFVNSLNSVLGPALKHHYRIRLGVLNHCLDQVPKWERQKEELLEQFVDRLLEPTKARHLDRRKAVEQSLKEVLEADEARRRSEQALFQRAYRLKKLVPLPRDAHESFVAQVRELVNETFPD